MRKITLLASMALVALAFAIPASASALAWSHNGSVLKGGETATQTYNGDFSFKWNPWLGAFTCSANITIEGSATSGKITNFELVPPNYGTEQEGECYGWNGYGFNECFLEGQSNNVGSGWNIDIGKSPATISAPGSEQVQISEYYESRGINCYKTRWNFYFYNGLLHFNPTMNGEGGITEFTLSGNDEHNLIYSFGPFTPIGSPELGLK